MWGSRDVDSFLSKVWLLLLDAENLCTGCSLNIVFFFEYFKIFRTLFSPGVSVCKHTRQVEHQRCSRTGRVQKNPKFSGKNTIFNEHPVAADNAADVT